MLVSLLSSLPQMWCDFSPGAREQTAVYLEQDTNYRPKTSFYQCPAQRTGESAGPVCRSLGGRDSILT